MVKFQACAAFAIVAILSVANVSAKDLTWGEWFSTLGGLLPTREQLKRCSKEFANKPDLGKMMTPENVLLTFESIDKNKDGEVTGAEMIQEGIDHGLSEDCAKGLKFAFDDRFKFIDMNNDGKYKRDDAEAIDRCTKAAKEIPELAQFQTPGTISKPDDVYQFFEKFDMNGDNEIKEDELVKFATDAGLNSECTGTLRQQFQTNLPFLDGDKDGKLTRPDIDQSVKCAKQFLENFPEYASLDPEKALKEWWTPDAMLEKWDDLDVNKDGGIAGEEITQFFVSKGVDAVCVQGWKDLFELGLKISDDNKDGKLSKDEL